MHHCKTFTAILFALTLASLPAQAESKFTRFVNDLKQKGKEVFEHIADKTQEPLENRKLFGLPNCAPATIEDAQIIEANASNNSRLATLNGYYIIDLSTLSDPDASDDALLSFTEKLTENKDIKLRKLPRALIDSFEHVANEHPKNIS